jgi:hypothetical protein
MLWMQLANLAPQSWDRLVVMPAVLSCGVLCLLLFAFRYRIRIDAHGVWRRRFVRWDLWPWAAFEGGRIHYGNYADQLIFPEKGRYWRTILTSVLSEADRTVFEAVVSRFWVPPPAPELPDLVLVKYGVRARLELSPDGIRLMAHKRDGGQLVAWPEVLKAEVLRATHVRSGFLTLNLHLPGRARPVRLWHHQGHPTWSGADAEVIALFLQVHLGDSRFEVTALGGPPADAAEADRRLTRLEQIEQKLRKLTRFCWYAYVVGTLLMAALGLPRNQPNPWNWAWHDWMMLGLKLAALASILGLGFGTVFGMVYFDHRDLRRQRNEVLRWKTDGSWKT